MANRFLDSKIAYISNRVEQIDICCTICKRKLRETEFYRRFSDWDEAFCSTCFPTIDLRCCQMVALEEIDHKNLVHVARISWNPQFNRGYCYRSCTQHGRTRSHTYWRGRLESSPEQFPYFVPSTWYRLSLKLNSTDLPDWGPNWHTLYHGTHPQNIHKIIENGFKVRECQHGFPAAYLSPSILYSSHPRYARVVVRDGNFYQFVLEVRVDVRKLSPVKKRETLSVGTRGDIDSKFPNNENLEFLFKSPDGTNLVPRKGVVVTGVMVRKTSFDPAFLPLNWWWCKWRKLWQLHKSYYNGFADDNSITN